MLEQSNYQRMIIDRRDNGVVVVTLNRPEKSNAIDTRMHHELMTFSKDFSDDSDLRVLVLAGAGKAFCSGGDFSADTAIEMPSLIEARRIIDNILECEKPLIAAVQRVFGAPEHKLTQVPGGHPEPEGHYAVRGAERDVVLEVKAVRHNGDAEGDSLGSSTQWYVNVPPGPAPQLQLALDGRPGVWTLK